MSTNLIKCKKIIAYQFKIIFIFLFFLSCRNTKHVISSNASYIEVPLQNMLPRPMTRAILSDSLEATIPIRLTDKEKNKLNNASFIIDRADSSVYLKSNEKGLVFITLNHSLVSENPLIKISHEKISIHEIQYSVGGKTVVFKDGKSIDNEVIEYENLPFIEQNKLKLYYTINPDTAKIHLKDFNNTVHLIKTLIGKENISLIFPLLVSNSNISVVGEPNNIILLPVNQNSWVDKYWHFTHETVENELINSRNVYQKNPNLRFIGDGLAEYLSLKILKLTDEAFANEMIKSRIYSLNKSTRDGLDLSKWTIEDDDIAGYSYGLAFWLKIERDNTQNSVIGFMTSFLSLDNFEPETVTNLLPVSLSIKEYTIKKDEALSILSSYR